MLAVQQRIDSLTGMFRERMATRPRARDFFLSEHPSFADQFRSATGICLVGATLSRTVRDYLGPIEHGLRAGAKVKVVIIDPRSDAARQAALRSYGVRQEDFYERRVKPTIDLLNVLTMLPDAKGDLEVRLLLFMPSFGLVLIGSPRDTHHLCGDLPAQVARSESLICARSPA